MELNTDVRLSQEEVMSLLNYFDDSSDIPLHEGLDFVSYSEKLSKYAHFVLAIEKEKQLGFIAYYLNDEKKFVYIPQIVVHRDGRHQGIGHLMLNILCSRYAGKYECVNLEVLKDNMNARRFYEREGFGVIEDHNERLLLKKSILL